MNVDMLSERERQVHERLEAGMTPQHIADEIGISRQNVYVICHNLKARKTRARQPTSDSKADGRNIKRALARELPRCSRCSLRGHEPGDPELCLPSSAAVYVERRKAGMKLSPALTGEWRSFRP